MGSPASGRDLSALRRTLHAEILAAIAEVAPELSTTGATEWRFGDLPRRVERDGVVGYPALVDEGTSVGVVVLDSPIAQSDTHRVGTLRLLQLVAPLPPGHLQRRLSNDATLALARSHVSLADLAQECAIAVIDEIIDDHGRTPFEAAAFEAMAGDARRALAERSARLTTAAITVLVDAAHTRAEVVAVATSDHGGLSRLALEDVAHQIESLVRPGFVASGRDHLDDIPRYLEAIRVRLERLPTDGRRDAERQAIVGRLVERYANALRKVGGGAPILDDAATEVPWMIEELRVSLWAQSLGTAYPVSETRIARTIEQITG